MLNKFVVVDLETTGNNPKKGDKIIQFAAVVIEDGKITTPLKGATLIGNGPEAMAQVSMVGNDLALDNGIGVCGKNGQSVPVGVGQPTLKIDAMTVGGTD